MNLNESWHYYLMATLYVLAGINHFIKPRTYKRIIPNYLPNPKILVILSGIIEISLGLAMLFTTTKNYALYSIILMLFAFLPVHLYMLSDPKASMGLPKWLLLVRLPLQFLLMYWAFAYL
ncbi:MauE/DoxX family redox-associated membrane protein [Pseudozobellia sp. WGM2]|uniref:DoxX family protein n=1 Tax=Pseudozobellia sp. WGM2 TaxID=2787625 RepID=UPI00352F3842